MEKQIRVRFAPSPTGPLHIGGVRTALFNYLFAKKNKGVFVLRIEDTDQKRVVAGAENYISDALKWCGLQVDEGPGVGGPFGPYKQSERQKIYKRYLADLLKNGQAYYAFDTAKDLELERKAHQAKGKTFIYNWHNRSKGRLKNSLVLSKEEVEKRLESGLPYVVRFLLPKNKTVVVEDSIRGKISVDVNTLDDKILFKSDGMPTYHLANVVDDHLMEISHVIRGEEWLPSLALHQLLYDAFGWKSPKFAHLPLILKPTGKGKLSKRDGDKLGFPVFPLQWEEGNTKIFGYKESGYFPEAVLNFLALLGWNPGTDQEFFSLKELIECFSLKQVNKAGARFDPEKIKWFNHGYLQQKQNTALANVFVKTTPALDGIDPKYVALVIGLIKERASLISEFWGLSHYFFVAPKSFDVKSLKKAWNKSSAELMRDLSKALKNFDGESVESLRKDVKLWIEQKGVGFGSVMMPFRVAIVGALEGVDLFEVLFCIGKNEAAARIKTLIDKS